MRSTSSNLNPKQGRRKSRRVLQYVTLRDFSPGIDARQDKTAIAEGRAQFCRNVIWNGPNGVYCRRGIGPLTYGRESSEMAPLTVPAVSYYNFRRGSESMATFLSQHLVVDQTDRLLVAGDWTGPVPIGRASPRAAVDGTWTVVPGVVRYGAPTYADWDLDLYISLGNEEVGDTNPMIRWDGTTATNLGVAWSEDIAAPTTGNMPRGRHVAYLDNRLYVGFVGGPAGQAKPNRVHFSHAGQAEAWRSEDWIDVGGSGDEITAMMPVRDMLVIFKRNSTWALLGNGPENFRVTLISEVIGCTGFWDYGPNGGVVFWDQELGVCSFDGKDITPMFSDLRPFMDYGAIRKCKGVAVVGAYCYVVTDFYGHTAKQYGVGVNKTWDDLNNAGVTWDGLVQQDQSWNTFAYTTYDQVWVLPPQGGWSVYLLAHPQTPAITTVGRHRTFVPLSGDVPGSASMVLGFNTAGHLLFLDRFFDGKDRWGNNQITTIEAYYQTAWMHGGLPAGIKRWKAPRVIQGAADNGPLHLDVYHDFDPWALRRTLTTDVVEDHQAFTYQVGKPGSIGRAKSVSLRLYCPEARQWSVQSITIPLYPKVLR